MRLILHPVVRSLRVRSSYRHFLGRTVVLLIYSQTLPKLGDFAPDPPFRWGLCPHTKVAKIDIFHFGRNYFHTPG